MVRAVVERDGAAVAQSDVALFGEAAAQSAAVERDGPRDADAVYVPHPGVLWVGGGGDIDAKRKPRFTTAETHGEEFASHVRYLGNHATAAVGSLAVGADVGGKGSDWTTAEVWQEAVEAGPFRVLAIDMGSDCWLAGEEKGSSRPTDGMDRLIEHIDRLLVPGGSLVFYGAPSRGWHDRLVRGLRSGKTSARWWPKALQFVVEAIHDEINPVGGPPHYVRSPYVLWWMGKGVGAKQRDMEPEFPKTSAEDGASPWTAMPIGRTKSEFTDVARMSYISGDALVQTAAADYPVQEQSYLATLPQDMTAAVVEFLGAGPPNEDVSSRDSA